MKWLVWKEYRLNRVVVGVGLSFLVVPYVLALLISYYGVGSPPRLGLSRCSESTALAAGYSLVLSQLVLAFFGGNAIACERIDRSGEFLAYLPLSRARILAGKMVLPVLAALVIWGVNLVLLSISLPEAWWSKPEFLAITRSVLPNVAITGLLFFAAGWMLSAIQESPTFAVVGGLLLPVFVVSAINLAAWLFEWSMVESGGFWYRIVCLVLAPVCWGVGTWYYLHYVEA